MDTQETTSSLYDATIPESKQRTLFPEPGSSGNSVLYFVLRRQLFPLVTPCVAVVKLPFIEYSEFRCADERKLQLLPSFPILVSPRSGLTSGVGGLWRDLFDFLRNPIYVRAGG